MGPVAVVSISWSHKRWQEFISSEGTPCPCIKNSGFKWIRDTWIGAEWWNFNFDPAFTPNKHSGRIYGYSPYRGIENVKKYINTGGQGKGIVFFVSVDLHGGGRKIVGVYGKAMFHGVDVAKPPSSGSYHGLACRTIPIPYPSSVPTAGVSLLFTKYSPPFCPNNLPPFAPFDPAIPPSIGPHNIPKSCVRLVPLISGETSCSTGLTHPLDAGQYLGKLPGRMRYFPKLIDDKAKARVLLQHLIREHSDEKSIKEKLERLIEDCEVV